MSLDVLAQVATETLEREPARKSGKRTLDASFLPLDHISKMSDKALINAFTVMNGNEMSRRYTYTCHLMPDICDESFQSFGNETRARIDVKAHLVAHIKELLKTDKKFYGETVAGKKKRIKQLSNPRLQKKKALPAKMKVVVPKTSKRKKDLYTVILENGSTEDVKEKAYKAKVPAEFIYDRQRKKKNGKALKLENFETMEEDAYGSTQSTPEAERSLILHPLERQQSFPSPKVDDEMVSSIPATIGIDHGYSRGKTQATSLLDQNKLHELSSTSVDQSSENTTPEGASLLRQLANTIKLCATVPASDLNQKHGVSGVTLDPDTNLPVIQVAQISGSHNDVPAAFIEETVTCHTTQTKKIAAKKTKAITEPIKLAMDAKRPYPPMPKLDPAYQGRIELPDISSDDESSTKPVSAKRSDKRSALTQIGNDSETERKLAITYIRELRDKKKEDPILICKICKDRTFTAAATLLYHYRSHAGIKPFVCLICNTTFTRQHSLNYHMLIHNNQSRFTCLDCGRKFRHPSHFKEHLRRHTGETPYHCSDCTARFKTRNTYKRHLRTRHGKLLTARGIGQTDPTFNSDTANDFLESTTEYVGTASALPQTTVDSATSLVNQYSTTNQPIFLANNLDGNLVHYIYQEDAKTQNQPPTLQNYSTLTYEMPNVPKQSDNVLTSALLGNIISTASHPNNAIQSNVAPQGAGAGAGTTTGTTDGDIIVTKLQGNNQVIVNANTEGIAPVYVLPN